MSLFKFKSATLAEGAFQSIGGSPSKFSNGIQHTITLDVSDNALHLAEAQRLQAWLDEKVTAGGYDVQTRSPFDAEAGTLRLQWGSKRHESVAFREVQAGEVLEIDPQQLPKLGGGSVASVGVELWLRAYTNKEGKQGVNITAYPIVVVVEHVEGFNRTPKNDEEKVQECVSYFIESASATGDANSDF